MALPKLKKSFDDYSGNSIAGQTSKSLEELMEFKNSLDKLKQLQEEREKIAWETWGEILKGGAET